MRRLGTMAAVLLTCSPSLWAQTSPSNDELSRKVDELRAVVETQQTQLKAQAGELEQLRANQNESWLNERRTEEVKALVREVLADADTRASLAANALTAGYNGQNFFLASEDGNFLLRIEGLVQVRYIFNHRQGVPLGTGEVPGQDDEQQTTDGFELGRTRVEFSGHVFSPRLKYFVRMAVDRTDSEMDGERMVLGYQFTDTLALWGGQDKGPFMREDMISPARQLCVEKSLVNSVFTEGSIQGIWATWDPVEPLHLVGSFNNGLRSGETGNEFGNTYILYPPNVVSPMISPFYQNRTDFAFTGRADWKVMGRWSQWEDFNSWSDDPTGLFFGGAVHYEVSKTGSATTFLGPGLPRTGLNDKFLTWTVDGSFKHQGFSIYGSFVGLNSTTDDHFEAGRPDHNYYGAMGQAAYMVIPDKLEPFVRFEWIDLDGNNVPGPGTPPQHISNDLYLLTAGANYYLNRHRAKFTVDVIWCIRHIPNSRTLGLQDNDGFQQGLGALGLREDAPGQSNQVVLRAQFQVMF